MKLKRFSVLCSALAVSALTACGAGNGVSPTPVTSAPVQTSAISSADALSSLATPASVPQFHGCPVFAAGDAYNSIVTTKAAMANSEYYVDSMYNHGADKGFAVYVIKPAAWVSNIASNATRTFAVHAPWWHQRDFTTPVPFDRSFFIEPQGDRHAVVVNTSTCRLYEMYDTRFDGTTLRAYSGWQWDMTKPFVGTSNTTPRAGTSNPSATASGLSEFAGAFRAGDVEAGAINHALNFAPPEGSISCSAIVWPATGTGGCGGAQGPGTWAVPYGAHFRLNPSFALSCGNTCPQAQMIVAAMKTYGIYISDTGSRGTALQLAVMPEDQASNPFNASDINHINQVKITDFEMIP